MDTLLSPLVLAFIALLALILIALLALELLAIRRVTRIGAPVMEYARTQAEQEATHIVEEARVNARALIARAETAATALAAERRTEDEAVRKAHEEALKSMRERLEAALNQASADARTAGEAAQAALTKEVSGLGETAREGFKAAVTASQAAFAMELEKALVEARAEADRYEKARREAVDSHIRELVAATTTIALAHSLPQEVNAELVLKALEEAKAARAFEQA